MIWTGMWPDSGFRKCLSASGFLPGPLKPAVEDSLSRSVFATACLPQDCCRTGSGCSRRYHILQHTPTRPFSLYLTVTLCVCVCRAAAARARGDFSTAAQLAADAVALKQAADAAHAAAAIKIEVTNNMHRPDGLVSYFLVFSKLNQHELEARVGHHTDWLAGALSTYADGSSLHASLNPGTLPGLPRQACR